MLLDDGYGLPVECIHADGIPPTLPIKRSETESKPSKNSANFSREVAVTNTRRYRHSPPFPTTDLALDGHEVVYPDPPDNPGKEPRVHDAEWLTPQQRAFVELVTDFKGTLKECARMAGYADPTAAVNVCLKNPYVVRGILRRYHSRMLRLARAFAPGGRVFGVAVGRVGRQRQVFVPAGGLAAKLVREMETNRVEGKVARGRADSILGREAPAERVAAPTVTAVELSTSPARVSTATDATNPEMYRHSAGESRKEEW